MKEETIQKIKETFQQVFGVDQSLIDENTSMENFNEWDSLRHLEIVTCIEQNFGIQFDMAEIINLNSVHAIASALEKRS